MTTTPNTDRKTPDRTPENDLRKALDSLRIARGKYILAGNESKGGTVLTIIQSVEKALGIATEAAK